MKKLVLASLGLIAGLIIILICSFTYTTRYKLTEVTTSNSPDDKKTLVVYMVGEPDWPFGATHCRFDLYVNNSKIVKKPFTLLDDGSTAGYDNFKISWNEEYVDLWVFGSEQEDEVYRILFDGSVESINPEIAKIGEKSADEPVSQQPIDKETSPNDVQATIDSAQQENTPNGDEIQITDFYPGDFTPSGELKECISETEFKSFTVTADSTDTGNFTKFDDFATTMSQKLVGTWYNPVDETAIRIYDDNTAFVYYPLLDYYGDTLYEWEWIDRSEEGKCPELIIDIYGYSGTGLAYYIAGIREEYFWCNAQAEIFYRQ